MIQPILSIISAPKRLSSVASQFVQMQRPPGSGRWCGPPGCILYWRSTWDAHAIRNRQSTTPCKIKNPWLHLSLRHHLSGRGQPGNRTSRGQARDRLLRRRRPRWSRGRDRSRLLCRRRPRCRRLLCRRRPRWSCRLHRRRRRRCRCRPRCSCWQCQPAPTAFLLGPLSLALALSFGVLGILAFDVALAEGLALVPPVKPKQMAIIMPLLHSTS